MKQMFFNAACGGWILGLSVTAWAWMIGAARKKKTAPDASTFGLSFTAYCSKYLTLRERRIVYLIILISIALILVGSAYSK